VAQATRLAQCSGFVVEAESDVAGPPFHLNPDDDDLITPAPSAIAGMTVLYVRIGSGAWVSVPCDASGVTPYQPVTWDFTLNQLVPAGGGPALPVAVLAVSKASIIRLFMTIFVRWSAEAAGIAVIQV
jgi:hypothetical protein